MVGRDAGEEVLVCKKQHTFSSTMGFIEYLVANEIIDQYHDA